MDLGQIQQSLAGATHTSDTSIAPNDEFRVLFENDPVVCFIERTRAIRNLPCVNHAQLRTRLRNGHTPCQIRAMEAQAIWKRSRATVCLCRLTEHV